ncbi:phage portal protein [Clostridium sp. E02]|uniref:phage portal protein n=1 Tax=Clostridium sp. E02 TaxID=2487134 RepID=UPI000F51EEB2|nr:phage portal protein [Clostridium sp. E02]
MNKLSYIDICKGSFGRKVAYTGASIITTENILKVVGKAVGVLNYNRPFIRYLHDYYMGDQPILYREKTVRPEINNKTVENHALEIVRFKAGQTYGEPIQYVSRKKDEAINKAVDTFNDYMRDAHKQARDIELGTWQSSVGTAYKASLKASKNSPIPFRIHISTPLNTIIVYSQEDGRDMLSVQQLKDENEEQYYLCFSEDKYFIIKNGRITKTDFNGFGGIPIAEYPNNPDRLSDIEIAITALDQINKMQSDRMNGIEQFVQAFMLFKNCEISKDEFIEMSQLGAIQVKDSGQANKSDVKLMTAELNQEQTQVSKDDLYRQVLVVEGMPDRQQNTGGDTGQAVYLRNGWDFAEQRARLDEPFIIEAEKKHCQIVLNILKQTTNDVPLSIRDFDVKITRNSTDNMLVKAQSLDYLLKNKIHPLIALITCGLFGDPEKVWVMSQPYMETVYKTQEQLDVEAEKEKAFELLKNQSNSTVKTGEAK